MGFFGGSLHHRWAAYRPVCPRSVDMAKAGYGPDTPLPPAMIEFVSGAGFALLTSANSFATNAAGLLAGRSVPFRTTTLKTVGLYLLKFQPGSADQAPDEAFQSCPRIPRRMGSVSHPRRGRDRPSV